MPHRVSAPLRPPVPRSSARLPDPSFFAVVTMVTALLSPFAASSALAAASNAASQMGLSTSANVESRARAHITQYPGHSLHGDSHTYQIQDITIDEDGTEHVRFDRHHKGLRVIGGDLVVHTHRQGSLQGISHTLTQLIDLSSRAQLTPAQANQAALAAHPGTLHQAKPELVVYARGSLPLLAYEVRIDGKGAHGVPSEKHVIVDANTAHIEEVWDDIHTVSASPGNTGGTTMDAGSGKSLFSGVVTLGTTAVPGGFELRDATRGGHTTLDMGNQTTGSGKVFKDADNAWGTGSVSHRATVAVDAHYGAAMTWDYFKNIHGRLGIANDGRGATSRVHFDSGFNNAFWSDACFCMTYGDGDGVTLNPLVALDVAGHEMTHGITSRTARLIYSGESGGLNEATSDIFGTAVEFYAKNTQDKGDYLIGEKLFKTSGRIIRSMIQPSVDGVSADCWYPGVGALDVHKSSGVANHFFYLLAEGTARGNPSPTCTAANTRVATGTGTLKGLGRATAEKIWYRALTRYMTSSTNFAGARAATLKAAADLYGAGGAQVQAVEAAWGAVNVH